MEKSIFSREYSILLRLLKETRRNANITQVDLAQRLEQSQSFVSKCERGESRIDVIQLRTICHALETTLPDFINKLELQLNNKRRKKKPD